MKAQVLTVPSRQNKCRYMIYELGWCPERAALHVNERRNLVLSFILFRPFARIKNVKLQKSVCSERVHIYKFISRLFFWQRAINQFPRQRASEESDVCACAFAFLLGFYLLYSISAARDWSGVCNAINIYWPPHQEERMQNTQCVCVCMHACVHK